MDQWHIGKNAQIFLPVPRTLFYTFVYPKLSNIKHWVVHYGDWALMTYLHRLISSIASIAELRSIFGDAFVAPRTCAELDGYNDNLEKGELSGYLLFLDYNLGFKISVCDIIFLLIVLVQS